MKANALLQHSKCSVANMLQVDFVKRIVANPMGELGVSHIASLQTTVLFKLILRLVEGGEHGPKHAEGENHQGWHEGHEGW
jgi:hypothetical protein